MEQNSDIYYRGVDDHKWPLSMQVCIRGNLFFFLRQGRGKRERQELNEISKHRERESKSKKKKQNCLHQSEVDRRNRYSFDYFVCFEISKGADGMGGGGLINVKERKGISSRYKENWVFQTRLPYTAPFGFFTPISSSFSYKYLLAGLEILPSFSRFGTRVDSLLHLSLIN